VQDYAELMAGAGFTVQVAADEFASERGHDERDGARAGQPVAAQEGSLGRAEK